LKKRFVRSWLLLWAGHAGSFTAYRVPLLPVYQSAWNAYLLSKSFYINVVLNYTIRQTPNINPYILWMQIALYGRVCTKIKNESPRRKQMGI
jgi:hypothetical protein